MPDNNLHSIIKLQNDIKSSKVLSVFLPKLLMVQLMITLKAKAFLPKEPMFLRGIA